MTGELDVLQEHFRTLTDSVIEAIDMVRNNVMPDMKSIDNRALELCNEVKRSTPMTAHAVKPVMSETIIRLDELEKELTLFKERTGG